MKAGVRKARREKANGGAIPVLSTRELLQKAVNDHQSGALDEAESAYRMVLRAHPDEPNALHLLGVLCHQKGRHDEAIRLIERAIAVDSSALQFHLNLGRILQAIGRLEDAEACLRRAVELNPKNPAVREHLGVLLQRMGRHEDAIFNLQAVLHLAPDAAPVHKRLANIYIEDDCYEEAMVHYEKYLAAEPDDAEANSNLGLCYEKQERLEEAARHYRKAAKLMPDHPQILSNLGKCLNQLGFAAEAERTLRRALELEPDNWQIRANLGVALQINGKFEDSVALLREVLAEQPKNVDVMREIAMSLYRGGDVVAANQMIADALALEPENTDVLNVLAGTHMANNSYEDAAAIYHRILDIDATNVHAALNLAMAYKYMRRMDEANLYAHMALAMADYGNDKFSSPLIVFRATCDFEGIEQLGDLWKILETVDASILSASFLDMIVHADTPEKHRRLFALHRRWGRVMEERAADRPLPEWPGPRKDGKVRLAFLSSDLRTHSVAKFVMPLLESYDRDRFEIYCYAPREAHDDKVQQKIKSLVDRFRTFRTLDPRDFAEVIRGDAVDILLELNGHTKDSMLHTLAFRPAPVQIEWLGYPFTTGLEDTDYFLVDRFIRPEDPDLLTEEPLEMPESWICFGEMEDEPIEEAPARRNGFVTFGSLNNPYKYTPEMIALWSRVLKEVPDSRFMIVRPEGRSMMLYNNLAKAFAANGIDTDRLYFVDNRGQDFSHLAYYNEIDISLDTFPVTGGTTTCESLWMGVPVISLYGESMHERLSYGVIRHAGYEEFCTDDPDAYVAKAAALAGDPDRLERLRAELRPALRRSPLCRSDDFVANFQKVMLEVARRHDLI